MTGRGPGEPGGDLLFHVLRRSTIGAEGFHGRVRDGIGCLAPRCDHQAVAAPRGRRAEDGAQRTARRGRRPQDSGQRTDGDRALVLRVRHRPSPERCRPSAVARALSSERCRSTAEFVNAGGEVPSSAALGCGALSAGWRLPLHAGGFPVWLSIMDRAVRAISTGQLHSLLRFHPRPIDVVVFHGSRRDLVLRGASRLDAFSGYPVRT